MKILRKMLVNYLLITAGIVILLLLLANSQRARDVLIPEGAPPLPFDHSGDSHRDQQGQ